jgi:hypothetical protein
MIRVLGALRWLVECAYLYLGCVGVWITHYSCLLPRRRSTKVEQHSLYDDHMRKAPSAMLCTVTLLMPRVAPHQMNVDVYRKQ